MPIRYGRYCHPTSSFMHRKLQFAIFFCVLAFLLFLVNFVSYKAFAALFGPSVLAGGILRLLSLGFVLVSVIGMRFYNAFTRVWYWIESIWMGFLAYLFIASAIYLTAASLSGHSLRAFGETLMFVSIVAALSGVIHGRKLAIIEKSISLPNLPDAWVGKKAVWISDTHLGQIYGACRAEKVVAAINGLSPDIVFIGGDLYDGASVPKIVETAVPFGRLVAPHGVYFVTGNHEEFGDASPFTKKIASLGIRILDNEKVDIDGLQIVGVDYAKTSKRADFEKIIVDIGIDRTKPSILLKHEPKDLDIAEKAGISFQISGHVHSGQQWPFEYVAKLVYKGYTYGLKPFGKILVYVSSGAGTWGPPLRVGSTSEIVAYTFEKAE